MHASEGRSGRVRINLTVKLAAAVVASFAAFVALFSYLSLREHRRHSEDLVVQSADRVSDLIRRSTQYQMLHNDREALYQMIKSVGSEPGMRRVRIFNEEGRVKKIISDFNQKHERRISPIVVDANEFVRLKREDKPFYENIERGIALWETE